jgi:phosphohistidine phosphatase SixA
MRWYFLRHAKTERESWSGKDKDRRLAPKGINQVAELKTLLELLPITAIRCSTAQRTRETAMACNPIIPITFSEELYLATLDQWKRMLSNEAQDHMLYIGHNDGISEYLTWLTGEHIHLQTGALVTVDFLGSDPRALGPGTACLVAYERPEV